MTLAELSGRSGLTMSTLSKIENDKVSLSYDKLRKLALGLGVDIGYFVAVEPAAVALTQQLGRRAVDSAGSGAHLETADYNYRYRATDLLNKKMTPMIIDIKLGPDDKPIEYSRHAGEEYFYVLEGRIRFLSDLYAPVTLSVGDSMYFDGGMGHAYQRVTKDPARILSVCCATFAELELARTRAVPDEDE
jgi:transcriptional regulator with XRE-family HTH domain